MIHSDNLKEIEVLLAEEPTKGVCKKINELRKAIDGYYLDSCFCTKSQRTAFVRETRYWLESVQGTQRSRGLGDTIAKVTHFFGIEPCEDCKKRQETLNNKFPYDSTGN